MTADVMVTLRHWKSLAQHSFMLFCINPAARWLSAGTGLSKSPAKKWQKFSHAFKEDLKKGGGGRKEEGKTHLQERWA